MKILVDVMPESAAKCKFHGECKDGVYICNVTGKKCPMCENQTCRVLKPFSECIAPYVR